MHCISEHVHVDGRVYRITTCTRRLNSNPCYIVTDVAAQKILTGVKERIVLTRYLKRKEAK